MLYSPSFFGIMILSIALGLVTQAWVNGAFKRWSKVPLATGATGAQVARRMLDGAGLAHVGIEMVSGNLTDHYDPRAQVLRLSESVYSDSSVAAAGVAAHEAGHAIQHAASYVPVRIRQALVPAANIGSQAAWFLIPLGFILNFPSLVWVGIALFASAVLFQFVTLPVEFDASRRALAALSEGSMIPSDQIGGARKVLTAAAMTYLAATLIAVLQLAYYVGLARRD
ncbi:MAG: zinc metallopeptidase [Actinomycetota bacterium]|nr:zinc metallopeptidase [Actinomycetota bacterium]